MPGEVNGSIWTLPFEMAAYSGIALLAWVGLLRQRTLLAPILAALMLTLMVFCDLNAATLSTSVLYDGARLGLFFAIGMSFYLWQDRVVVSGRLALFAAGLWLASPWIVGPRLGGDWQLLGAVPLAYLTLWLGIRLPLSRIGRKRDLSYGVYLYAWPIQQLLTMWGVPGHGWVLYSSLSISASVLLAFVSWHCVESPMLKHKDLVAGPPRATGSSPQSDDIADIRRAEPAKSAN